MKISLTPVREQTSQTLKWGIYSFLAYTSLNLLCFPTFGRAFALNCDLELLRKREVDISTCFSPSLQEYNEQELGPLPPKAQLINRCPVDLKIAVRYRDYAGNWRMDGWIQLPSGEDVYLPSLRTQTAYLYILNGDEVIQWDSSSKSDSYTLGQCKRKDI